MEDRIRHIMNQSDKIRFSENLDPEYANRVADAYERACFANIMIGINNRAGVQSEVHNIIDTPTKTSNWESGK